MSDQVDDAELQSEQSIINTDETLFNRGDQSYRQQFTGKIKKNKIKNLIKITLKSNLRQRLSPTTFLVFGHKWQN